MKELGVLLLVCSMANHVILLYLQWHAVILAGGLLVVSVGMVLLDVYVRNLHLPETAMGQLAKQGNGVSQALRNTIV